MTCSSGSTLYSTTATDLFIWNPIRLPKTHSAILNIM